MTPELIDLDADELTWVESEWIRPNSPLLYPSDDVPAVVKEQCELLLQLPPATDELIPHDFVPVLTLLDPNSNCPCPRPDLLSTPVDFTRDASDPNPHAIVKALKTRATIPPRSTIQRLEINLGQAWFNGDTSITDTHYADYPLPFWVITLWSRLHFVHKTRMDWISAEELIRKARVRDREANIKLRLIIDSILDTLGVLSWHAPLAGFPSAGWRGQLELSSVDSDAPIGWTTDFIQFFQDCFLNDEAVNMMLHWIRLQVQRDDNLRKTTIIGDLSFTNALLKNFASRAHTKRKIHHLLTDCEDEVKHLGRKHLFLVFNPSGNHWAITLVDFELRSRAYGDSLASTYRPDKAGIEALDFWLNSAFPIPGRPFTIAPNIPCERQVDGISCGIAACTLISSQLGLEAPWSALDAKLSRFNWALRLMQIHQAASTNGYMTAGNPEAIVHVDDANNPVDTHSFTVEPARDHLESPAPLALDEVSTPASSLPYDSPSPLSTNNWNSAENYSENNRRVDYVERDGVLYFVDSDDDYIPGSGAQPPEIPLDTNNHGKHPRHSSASDSSEPPAPKRRLISESKPKTTTDAAHRKAKSMAKHDCDRQSGPTGISKTTQADRARLELAKSGNFIASHDQLHGLLLRAREIDPGARLDPNDKAGRRIIHSVCGVSIQLDGPLRTSRLGKHHKMCKSTGGLRKNGKWTKAAQGCPKISSIFTKLEKPFNSSNRPQKAPWTSTASIAPPLPTLSPRLLHCLGLRPAHHEKIQAVVERSTHGGTKSIHAIARQNYGKEYNSLTGEEKVAVRIGVTATAEWTVYLDPAPHIRHKDCLKTCDPSALSLTPSDICSSCASLLKTPSFQKAMARKPVEDPANLKYVPHASRQKNQAKMYLKYVGLQKIIDDADSKSTTPRMQFVHHVVQGKVDNSRVFSGLIQTIAAKEDKLARGVGMQSLRYPPGWTDFCLIAHSMSPRVYQFLGSSGFPVLGERDLRKRRSRSLGFPTGICDQTFERASKFLSTLGYTGPVSISCDDTQLLSKWSPYYDGTAKKWLVLGGTGDPIEVDNSVEDVHGYLVKATEGKEQASKATAAPKIPVFILAAMAIGPSMKADNLFANHSRLIQGLLDAEVCVSSYACDGSATERKVTQLFIESATDQQTIEIPHPEPGFEPHRVTLYFYGPKRTPIVSIQDSKHAAKTFRNGLCSGTRIFVMTNCALYYQQLLALSRHPNSPLYQRDMVKLDRQDDRAALRLFSSATIRHIFTVMKEQAASPNPDPVLSRDLTGLAVYIFIIGELVDVFQNRFLTISERCRMVFRARYFMEIWSSSLTALGYSHNTHFITCDAQQILQYLFDGFIALLLVYRDHLDHDNYPLLPWLHSTEPAEHTFGELRKLKPDFTYSDFLHVMTHVTSALNPSA